MAEAVQGIDVILLYRILDEAGTASATKLAFQTEHDISESNDIDTTQTKSGPIAAVGSDEVEISMTSILARDDEMVKKLRDARRNKQLVEVWEVDTGADPEADKHPATYYQGYLTEFSKTAGAEDTIEISMSYTPNGHGVDGEATLTPEQREVVTYLFKDTTPDTGA